MKTKEETSLSDLEDYIDYNRRQGDIDMVRLIKKDKSNNNVSNKNKSYYIKEGKQVGDLYHICTLDALVDYIIPENKLEASGKYWNRLLDTDEAVSFTRDPLFVVPTWTVRGAPILFQFVIDGDKLSNRYKITPYNGNYTDDDESHTHPKYFEKEEVVIGPITNFKSYIKEVHFDIKILGERLLSCLSYIKEVKDYLGSIPCNRKQLPFLQDDWSIDYKKSSKEYSLYKIKTLDDLLKYIDDVKTQVDNIDSIKDITKFIDTQSLFDEYLTKGYLNKNAVEDIVEVHPEWVSDRMIVFLFRNFTKPNKIFQDLLESRLDKLKNDTKENLLELFCRYNNIEMVKLLLNKGVRPTDKLFFNVLVWKYYDLAKVLVDYVKDVNIHDSIGMTPLFYAVNGEQYEFVNMLLDRGAELSKLVLNVVVSLIDNPLGKMFDIILNKGKFTDDLLVYAAVECVGINNITYLKKLINKGLDMKKLFETLQEDGLLQSCKSRMLKFLLDKGFGAYIDNSKSFMGYVLSKAISSEDKDTLNLLLNSYVDKDKLKQLLNSSGLGLEYPIEKAIKIGNLDIIELLLKNGAEAEPFKKKNGNQARSILNRLDSWLDKRHIDIAKLLIKYGAEVDVYSLKNFIGNNDINMVKLLLENGGDKVINDIVYTESCIHWGLDNKNIEMIKLLLEHGADVNLLTKKGMSSYQINNIITDSNKKENIEIFHLLLNNGLDANAILYKTPILETAISKRNTELVKLLLEHGADVNKVDIGVLSKNMRDVIDKYIGTSVKTESIKVRKLYRNKY